MSAKKYFTDEERRAMHTAESREYRKRYPHRFKATNAKWRAKNPDKVKAMSRRQRERSVLLIDNIRKSGRCFDCGNIDNRVLEFDHVPERGVKKHNITNNSLGIKAREVELSKCDLVCANCHRIRTYQRRILKGER